MMTLADLDLDREWESRVAPPSAPCAQCSHSKSSHFSPEHPTTPYACARKDGCPAFVAARTCPVCGETEGPGGMTQERYKTTGPDAGLRYAHPRCADREGWK